MKPMCQFDIYIIEIHTNLNCNFHMSVTEEVIYQFNIYITEIYTYLNYDHQMSIEYLNHHVRKYSSCDYSAS